VLRFDDHTDPARLELGLDPVRDLGGEPLLDLKVPGEEVNGPPELRKADDPSGRQVGNVRRALEGQQMMGAERLERDVANQDELVVALFVREGRRVEGLRGEQFRVGLRNAPGGLAQVL
jgi:hypothetical protein